jgi:large subunit ribosomal protein L4
VIDELTFEAPRTKDFVEVLGNLKIERSCLVTINDYDDNLYKSARNIKRVDVTPVSLLNAGDICNHSKMLFTKEAFLSLLNKEQMSKN